MGFQQMKKDDCAEKPSIQQPFYTIRSNSQKMACREAAVTTMIYGLAWAFQSLATVDSSRDYVCAILSLKG